MPKKKAKNKFDNDDISNAIIKKYGDFIESGDAVLDKLQNFAVLSISPALDWALGGGLREGSSVVMTGDPKTGKTTTALYAAAKAQAQGKKVVYVSTEGRLTKENFTGIKGLKPEEILIVQPTDADAQISAQQYLSIMETYIKQYPDLFMIVDSVSNMVPQEELDGDIRSGVRNNLPRLLSMYLKRVSNDIQRTKAIVVYITHNIANTNARGPWSPQKMADCGNMLQYMAGTNMVITHRGKWTTESDGGGAHVGQIAHWKILTSAAGGIPHTTAESWIRYGIGIDELQELFHLATEFGLVKRSGAWYTLPIPTAEPCVQEVIKENNVDPENTEEVEKLFKFQGAAKLVTFLEEHPKIMDHIKSQLSELA